MIVVHALTWFTAFFYDGRGDFFTNVLFHFCNDGACIVRYMPGIVFSVIIDHRGIVDDGGVVCVADIIVIYVGTAQVIAIYKRPLAVWHIIVAARPHWRPAVINV